MLGSELLVLAFCGSIQSTNDTHNDRKFRSEKIKSIGRFRSDRLGVSLK